MNNKTNCPNGTMPYTIKSGDTFYLIAKTFGITVESLMKANPNVKPENLYIGQVICVPGGCAYGTEAHMIKKGDTLYKLSLEYKVPVGRIIEENPGIKPDNLVVGEVICIPKY